MSPYFPPAGASRRRKVKKLRKAPTFLVAAQSLKKAKKSPHKRDLSADAVLVFDEDCNVISSGAEQQALAKWGLNFVIEEYLPRKLRNAQKFLP